MEKEQEKYWEEFKKRAEEHNKNKCLNCDTCQYARSCANSKPPCYRPQPHRYDWAPYDTTTTISYKEVL